MELLYKKTSLVPDSVFEENHARLASYISQLNEYAQSNTMDVPEASINAPFDEKAIKAMRDLCESLISTKLKYIFVIGIGGSNLGTKAIYDAIFGYKDILEPNRFPKLIFLDTNNAQWMADIKKFVEKEVYNPEEVLISATSKSGGTTETIANVRFLVDIFLEKGSEYKERFVCISDPHSKLWEEAKNEGFHVLDHPKNVGGRYSVFTSVGLFPLCAAGIHIDKLLEGAREVRDYCLIDTNNLAVISASILAYHHFEEKTINVNFFFHTQFESIGRWYSQLMGESIGKEYDTNGNQVFRGITPLTSFGSTDLHSVGQLFLGGPKDKVTNFVYAKEKSDIQIPKSGPFSKLVNGISGKTAKSILEAILVGVKEVYSKQKLPFMELVLSDTKEKSLGEYMQFKMMEMMFLGQLLEVNPFDQPNVESYKVETRKILEG